ncbi:MAG: hypothetical protein JNJ55_09175 [Betaproteobacteria bacterium]|nr:hypothetical protein [Betaproteobacteria bacterium]
MTSRKRRIHAAGILCTALAGSGFAAADPADGSARSAPLIALQVPANAMVNYRGAPNLNTGVGSTAAMLYPAPNAAAALAALLTHGIMNSIGQRKEAERAQTEADKVLEPFASAINFHSNDQLYRDASSHLNAANLKVVASSDLAAERWLVTGEPVVWMAQDKSALYLDLPVQVFSPGGRGDPVYGNGIRVVSEPLAFDGKDAFWSDNDGARLKSVSARLFAEAVQIAVDAAMTPYPEDTSMHRTVRFPQGKAERIERSQVIRANCERTLLRTLRGGLLSVPTPREFAEALPKSHSSCQRAPM